MKGKHILTGIALLVPFCVVFQIAHDQRVAVQPLKVSGNRITSVALLAKSYALSRDGMWPPLNPETRSFELPAQIIPRGFEIGSRFNDRTTGPVHALLLGNINNAKAYVLAPMDDFVRDYLYPGYATASESEMLALIQALRGAASVEEDIAVDKGLGTLGSAVLYRLSATLPDTLVKDGVIDSQGSESLTRIPVLIERPRDGFSWVYFINGHLVRLPYPGPFPMTERVITGLAGTL